MALCLLNFPISVGKGCRISHVIMVKVLFGTVRVIHEGRINRVLKSASTWFPPKYRFGTCHLLLGHIVYDGQSYGRVKTQ